MLEEIGDMESIMLQHVFRRHLSGPESWSDKLVLGGRSLCGPRTAIPLDSGGESRSRYRDNQINEIMFRSCREAKSTW